jgi:hypothetical protein
MCLVSSPFLGLRLSWYPRLNYDWHRGWNGLFGRVFILLPSLLQFLQTFIQKDLSLETSDKYYTEAGSYDSHTILLDFVAQTCAKDFERMAEASNLLSCMSPDFFLRVFVNGNPTH